MRTDKLLYETGRPMTLKFIVELKLSFAKNQKSELINE